MKSKHLIITGIRGIPASHGGFETFAEFLSLYMMNKGWDVTVYCQEETKGATYCSSWKGVNLVHVYAPGKGAFSTIIFDFKSIIHSLRYQGVFLTLGYNTAVFNVFYRIFSKNNVINMDGIEWKREKWGRVAKAWFWLNERFGCWFGNHLIADHPEILSHLKTRVSCSKITMIPYGAQFISEASKKYLDSYGLVPDDYAIVIARPEPENSIYEIVKGFSLSQSSKKLVLLGKYFDENVYHKSIKKIANENVIFLGAIYDNEVVSALRYYSSFYIHGHQVGGTNPSLVESLGAGNAVIAHDNKFNQWVAKDSALYFSSPEDLCRAFLKLCDEPDTLKKLRENALKNYQSNFTWTNVLSQYESLISNFNGDGK